MTKLHYGMYFSQSVIFLPTSQSIDEEAEEHRNHRDKYPVRHLLILHATVDANTGFVTLKQN